MLGWKLTALVMTAAVVGGVGAGVTLFVAERGPSGPQGEIGLQGAQGPPGNTGDLDARVARVEDQLNRVESDVSDLQLNAPPDLSFDINDLDGRVNDLERDMGDVCRTLDQFCLSGF